MSSSASILVAGDVMLDYYWSGQASRLSPEAPVPIVKIDVQTPKLGGAANVALNLANLNIDVVLCGIVGNDVAGSKIKNIATTSGIRTKFLWGESRTTEKIRVLAQNQQIVRVDFEEFCSASDIKAFNEIVSQEIKSFRYIIFSDYLKGSLTHSKDLIQAAINTGSKVFVDPKGIDYSKYTGATCITPNRSELALVVGKWNSEEELITKAQNLRKDLRLEKLLLTRSEEGMTLFGENEVVYFPTQAREVYDVSGAGDTAIAVLVKCLAEGYEWCDAVTIANKAAGIVVGKLGTATVTLQDWDMITS